MRRQHQGGNNYYGYHDTDEKPGGEILDTSGSRLFYCCFLWGSASPAIKIGYELFSIGAGDLASRFVFAGVRFFLAGMMVIAFGSAQQRRFLHPSGNSWKYVFVLMTFQTILQYIFSMSLC